MRINCTKVFFVLSELLLFLQFPVSVFADGNDKLLPVVTIEDCRLGETHMTSAVNIPIFLSKASYEPITVRYATSDMTAIDGKDYKATNGILTIPAGSQAENIQIMFIGDRIADPWRRFRVTLSKPDGAILSQSKSSAIITIEDDDPAPEMTITKCRYRDEKIYVKGFLKGKNPEKYSVMIYFRQTETNKWYPKCYGTPTPNVDTDGWWIIDTSTYGDIKEVAVFLVNLDFVTPIQDESGKLPDMSGLVINEWYVKCSPF